MKIFSFIEKDAAILLAALMLLLSVFSYVFTRQSGVSSTDVNQTVTAPERIRGEQAPCSGSKCDLNGENSLSHSQGSDQSKTATENADNGSNAYPWNSSSSEKGASDKWKPTQKSRNLLLFAALAGVFITLSFVSYYVPLRFFLKRAGYTVSSLKLYLQGFASMVIMAIMFSAVLLFAGQLMFS